MENVNRELERKSSVTVDHYIKKINESVNIPEVLKERTRYGGYVCWPDKKVFSKKEKDKN